MTITGCFVSLVVIAAQAQAADQSGVLVVGDLVGAWEIDSAATIRRAVDHAPQDEKERVRQELSLLLPKQQYVFAADGTYKVTTQSTRGNIDDTGTFTLKDGNLKLVSAGKGGTRELEIKREQDKFILRDDLVLTRQTTKPTPSATTRPAVPNRNRAVGRPADSKNNGSELERTPLAGVKGDKNSSTLVSKTDRMTGFQFELTEAGQIGRVRPISQKQRFPKEAANQTIVAAREGYILYGLKVESKGTVNAVQLSFARLNADGTLDSNDAYDSDWVGKRADGKLITLGCNGKIVCGFDGSMQDGLLSGISLTLKPSFADDSDAPKLTRRPAAAEEPRHPIVQMLNELSAVLNTVKDDATARQALDQIKDLKAKYQNAGLGKVKPQGMEPLMQRVQQKVKAIQQSVPESGKAIEAASMDLVVSMATPQEKVAASDTAKRLSSASKMKQIAIAVLMHQSKAGDYPVTLDELVKSGSLRPDVLDSPMGNVTGGDFVYLRPANPALNGPMLYDAAALAGGEGTNVAFVDGSVQWKEIDQLKELNIPSK